MVIFGHSNSGLLELDDYHRVENNEEQGGDDLHDKLGEHRVDNPGVGANCLFLQLTFIPACCIYTRDTREYQIIFDSLFFLLKSTDSGISSSTFTGTAQQ